MECGEPSPLLFSHNAKRRGLAALHTLRVDALNTHSEKAVNQNTTLGGRRYSIARVSKRLTDESAAQQSRAVLYQSHAL